MKEYETKQVIHCDICSEEIERYYERIHLFKNKDLCSDCQERIFENVCQRIEEEEEDETNLYNIQR